MQHAAHERYMIPTSICESLCLVGPFGEDQYMTIAGRLEELIFQTEVVTHNLIKLIRAIRGDNGYSGWRYLIHLHVKFQPVEKFDYGGSRKVAFVVKEVINAIQVKSGTKFQVFK